MSNEHMTDIVFYEAFEEEVRELQTLLGPAHRATFSPKTIQESGDQSPPASLVSIRTQSVIPVSWDAQLAGILSRSTGYDHLLSYRRLTNSSLPLGYLEEYSSRAVAEHALLLVLALLRKLPLQLRQFPTFQRDGLTGMELGGRRILVAGVGRIGSEIVRLFTALGCTVRGVDLKPEKPGITYVSKEDGIAWAEVIICAMNLTSENTGYFSYDLMRRARQGTIFVNVARGEHAPLTHLGQLLADGFLGAIGLDVFEDEGTLAAALRDPAGHSSPFVPTLKKLLNSPNVICTPHNAFNSREALRRKSSMTVEQIEHFRHHQRFKWQIP
jgi:D-lactate dehydrogenase